MKYLIVGYGNQGKKRAKIINKKDYIFYDPFIKSSKYKNLNDLPINKFNNVLLCCSDEKKINLIKFFLKKKKNILVEKPVIFKNKKEIKEIKNLLKKNKVILYTAYNHRFEPGLIQIKKKLKKLSFGINYILKLFYGNGTSILVKNSKWKDKQKGILFDLGSHLLDIVIFLFEEKPKNVKLISKKKFENRFEDHLIFSFKLKKISVFCEITYCMWKNSFYLDLISKKGSIHMESLCKWSDTKIQYLKRKFPSGYPSISSFKFKKGDPTWKAEHKFFENLIKNKMFDFSVKNLEKDALIFNLLNNAK